MRHFFLRTGILLSSLLIIACSGTSPDGDGGGGTTADMGAGGMGGTGGMGGMPMGCESTCQPGLVQCAGDAIETCADANRDGCYDWTMPVGCAEGYTCSNGICTDPSACSDECADGATQCGMIGIRRCAPDFDGDSCTDWGPEEPCAEGESCSNGECSAGPCQPECGEGATRCSGAGVQTCGQYDVDECLEWSMAASCGENLTCSNGECTDPDECTDECTADTTECVSGNQAFARCGQSDLDPCLELGEQTRCAEGEVCASGACGPADQCVAECVDGERRCTGNGYRTCVNVVGCQVFGAPQPCEPGMGCVNGQCVEGAVDECPSAGLTQCDGNGFVRCGQSDADAALEWSIRQPCPQGETCSNGLCGAAAECGDECQADWTGCGRGGVLTCGQFDGDPCLDRGGLMPCGAGQSCSAGACGPVANCQDECDIINATQCGPEGTQEYRTCGDYDADDCLDWSAPIVCQNQQICDGGSCVDRPDPGNNDNAVLDIFAPDVGATVSGDLVEIRINAVDPDGVQNLRVMVGEHIVADVGPEGLPGGWFTTRWNSQVAQDGVAIIRAVLTDAGGLTLERTREIRIDNNGPTVVITSPSDGRILGGTFQFAARLTDGSGIQSYAFLVGRENVSERLDVPAEMDSLEHEVEVDASDFDEGPIVLTVRATDRFGLDSEASINVEFRSGTIIESIAPRAPGGRFPTVTRPFDWTIRAVAPAGVTSVAFQVDGQEVSVDNAAPYVAQIDPAVFQDTPSNCPDGQHELIAIVTDANQQIERGSWCAQWDQDLPEILLVAPDAPGALLALEGNSYTVEVAVEDADPRPVVTIAFNGNEVGRVVEPPYAVSIDAAAILAGLTTHDQEIEVEITATDYLGNSDHLALPVRVTRGDWAMTSLGFRGVLAEGKNDNVLLGLWSGIRRQGRLIMLGAAGSGGAIWDLNLRPGFMPVEAFFYSGSSAVGVRCDIPGGSVFVHVDPDGRSWNYDVGGVVRKAVGGPGSFTYVHVGPGTLVGIAQDGVVSFVHDFSDEMIAQRIQSIQALGNGDVLVHTIGVEDAQLNVMRRWNVQGQEEWNYAVGGSVTQNHVDTRGTTMIFGRTDVQGGDQAELLTRIDFDTGNMVWEWAAPLDVNLQSSGFRGDGAYLWRGINLHTAQSHIMALRIDDGEQTYRQAPAASPAGGFSPPGYDLISTANLLPQGDIVAAVRRPDGVIAGQSTSAIYRVSVDGRVTRAYNSAAAVMRGGQLIAPGVQSIASAQGMVGAALHTGATGRSELIMLNTALDLQWALNMPDGVQVNRLHMASGGLIDVTATSADEGDSIFPVATVDGVGHYPWRIHRPQAEIGAFVGTEGALYVMLNYDNRVDVVRIPRD